MIPQSTLAEHVAAATAIPVAPALIGPEAMASIRAVAERLPGNITSFFGFECPLDTLAPRADFLLSVNDQERAALEAASAAFSHDAWRAVRRFVTKWADRDSLLHERVLNMWLEFDIEDTRPDLPVPSVFFGAPDGVIAAGQDNAWLTATALPALHEGLGEPVLREVDRCAAALPAGAWIFQVGVMLARAADGVRLCIRNIAPADAADFLAARNWPGPLDELRELLLTLRAHAARVDLDIDVAGSVLPKIGLECYTEPTVDARGALLDLFESRGWCCAPKANALRHPTVFTHERLHRAVWPASLLAVSELMGPRADSVFLRGLHHIKAVYEPGRPVRAKAYLAERQDWMDSNVLAETIRQRRAPATPAPAEATSC